MLKRELEEHAKEQADEIRRRGALIEPLKRAINRREDHVVRLKDQRDRSYAQVAKLKEQIDKLQPQNGANRDRIHHMSNEMGGMRDCINKLEEDKCQTQRFIKLRLGMVEVEDSGYEAEQFNEERRFLRVLLTTLTN
jgi:chromosome segregation ATPase